MIEATEEGTIKMPNEKEYQTLFWVPMLFQTAKVGQNLVEDMLAMISNYYDQDTNVSSRRSILEVPSSFAHKHRRQQIQGDQLDTEVVTTRVEVVPKSENTKYTILNILKVRIFSKQSKLTMFRDIFCSANCKVMSLKILSIVCKIVMPQLVMLLFVNKILEMYFSCWKKVCFWYFWYSLIYCR